MVIICIKDKNEVDKTVIDLPWAIFRRSKLCAMAMEEEKVVGVSAVIGLLNISATYVTEEYRNFGLGRTLLGNVILAAKRKNYSFILGAVGWETSRNVAARKIARKVRFRKIIEVGNQTLIIWPIKQTTGKFVFISACIILSLIPKTLRRKLVTATSGLNIG